MLPWTIPYFSYCRNQQPELTSSLFGCLTSLECITHVSLSYPFICILLMDKLYDPVKIISFLVHAKNLLIVISKITLAPASSFIITTACVKCCKFKMITSKTSRLYLGSYTHHLNYIAAVWELVITVTLLGTLCPSLCPESFHFPFALQWTDV